MMVALCAWCAGSPGEGVAVQELRGAFIITLPEQPLAAVSVDAVIPLIVSFTSMDGLTLDDMLSWIVVDVRSKASPGAGPVPGALSAHGEDGLLLWVPERDLDPLTTYTMTVRMDEGGPSRFMRQILPDPSATVSLTTAAGVLEAQAPRILAMEVTYSDKT
jgi:hypothetical protein